MQDQIVVENQSMDTISFELGLDAATDFADIMSVKEHDFALGDPLRRARSGPVVPRFDREHNQFVFEEADGEDELRTQVIVSQPGEVNASGVVWKLELAPRESWHVASTSFPSWTARRSSSRGRSSALGEERGRVRESLAAWELRGPQIRASWDQLGHSFTQSVADLAALRMRGAGRVGTDVCPPRACLGS